MNTPLILHIDTATAQATVALSEGEKIVTQRRSSDQKEHAAWIHVAIETMLQESGIKPAGITAVSVVAGPGSYTGLRVGMATAKGFCYALSIPLITLNTLPILAFSAKTEAEPDLLICPMLDARRMEVYTALYDAALHELVPPVAMILDDHSFSGWLETRRILFVGDGIVKWKPLAEKCSANAVFSNRFYEPAHIAAMAQQLYAQDRFTGLAYAEPIYLKDFYTHHKNTLP